MRKIESEMVQAIREGRNFYKDNTMVVFHTSDDPGPYYSVFLHGNEIAKGAQGKTPFMINFCGWVSKTTTSRLRAMGIPAGTRKYQPTLDGKEVDSYSWIFVEAITGKYMSNI